MILAGDLNCCLLKKDRNVNTHVNDKSRKELMTLINDLNMVDVWAHTKTDQAGYTYTDARHKTKSRLDYIIIADKLKEKVDNICNKVITFIPDHLSVSMRIKIINNKRGPGYWKLNADILN